MAEGHIIKDRIIVDEDEGSIYLPPQLKKYLDQKYQVITWSVGWFDELEKQDEISALKKQIYNLEAYISILEENESE